MFCPIIISNSQRYTFFVEKGVKGVISFQKNQITKSTKKLKTDNFFSFFLKNRRFGSFFGFGGSGVFWTSQHADC